jgi:two-component sensor histidine kinase
VRRVLQADRVVVFHIAPNGSGTVIQESVAAGLPAATDLLFPNEVFPDDCYAFYCQGNARIISGMTQERSECFSNLMQQLGVKSKIVAPIIQSTNYYEWLPQGQSQNNLWGLLIAHACFQEREWLSSEVNLLQQLATQVGIAIQQASLYTQLKNQLAQKEVLLTEIHHRVKNNLQVISSMLWLQTKTNKHLTVSDALADTRNRLQAMALIHETLYQSGDLGKVNFHDYIQRLASSILSAHSDRSTHIQLIYHLQPVTLNLETAIPCGLLLNELITNAIKHAFPNEQDGEVCIMLEQLSQAVSPPYTPEFALQGHSISRNQGFSSIPRYVLTVQDNGIGIPHALDLKNLKSLGLKITYDLALQLRGTLELQRINGTRFRLFFSPLGYCKRF